MFPGTWGLRTSFDWVCVKVSATPVAVAVAVVLRVTMWPETPITVVPAGNPVPETVCPTASLEVSAAFRIVLLFAAKSPVVTMVLRTVAVCVGDHPGEAGGPERRRECLIEVVDQLPGGGVDRRGLPIREPELGHHGVVGPGEQSQPADAPRQQGREAETGPRPVAHARGVELGLERDAGAGARTLI